MWSPSLLLLLISTIVLIASTVSQASKDDPTTGNIQHAAKEDQYQASSLPHKRVKRVKIKEVSQLEPEEYESTKKIVEDCLTELRANKTRVGAELATARAQLADASAKFENAEQKWKEKKEKSEEAEEGEGVDELQEIVHKQRLQIAADSAREILKIAERDVEQLLAGEADKFAGAQRLQAVYAGYRRDLPAKIEAMTNEEVLLQRKFHETLLPRTEAEAALNTAKRYLKTLKCTRKDSESASDCEMWKKEESAARAALAAAAVSYDAAAEELRNATRSVLTAESLLTRATSSWKLDNFIEAWLKNAKATKDLKDADDRRGSTSRDVADRNKAARVKKVFENHRDEVRTRVTSLENELTDLDGEITKGEQQAKSIQQKIELIKDKETPKSSNKYIGTWAIIACAFIAISVVTVTLCLAKIWHNKRKKENNKKAVINLPKPFRYKNPPNSDKDKGTGSDSSSNAAQPSKRDSNKESPSTPSSHSDEAKRPSQRSSEKKKNKSVP